MNPIKYASWFFSVLTTLVLLVSPLSPAQAQTKEPVNKLLYMYRFFYLPFSIEFEQGRSKEDVLPFFPEKYPNPSRLLLADELKTLDKEWGSLKEPWDARSLLEKTPISLDQSVNISRRLISHRLSLTRSAFDRLPINDRIQLKEAMKSKSIRVQNTFKQILFLKSLIRPEDMEKFNFFLVGASWCSSTREYKILLETYAKNFPNADYNLHAIIIDDPNEVVFKSKLLTELFPNEERYSHNSIPRFLALQVINGNTKIWEEGEALREFYSKFFEDFRGFLNHKTSLLRNFEPKRKNTLQVDPYLSSATK